MTQNKQSLIFQLPKIVEKWKKEVEKIMEQIANWWSLKLQTNEVVIPSKDSNYKTLFENFNKTYEPNQRHNKLIYGDNLLTMATLIAGDEVNWVESMRWKIDLIYIDPPFDSKADYQWCLERMNQKLFGIYVSKTCFDERIIERLHLIQKKTKAENFDI